jgi:hypothetical protein
MYISFIALSTAIRHDTIQGYKPRWHIYGSYIEICDTMYGVDVAMGQQIKGQLSMAVW